MTEPTTTFILEPIEIHPHEFTLHWKTSPETTLFNKNECSIRFPESIDLRRLPDGFIERIAVLLLHPYWPLLSPCKIDLPFTLSAEEKQCWERLITLQWDTLQGHVEKENPLILEWSFTGPTLSSEHQPIVGDGCSTAFSGGKDSLFQTGFLLDQGSHPLLVSTISDKESTHQRKLEVDRKVTELTGLELIQVETNYRSIYNNLYPRELGWLPAVNELNDVILYLANLLMASASRNIPQTYVASESDVQASVKKDHRWIQHPHAMYSLVTLKVIEKLFSPYGMKIGSLTAPINQYQVQKTLWIEWPALRALQTTCWRMSADEDLCNECRDCLKASLTSFDAGEDPREMGADLVKNLAATDYWHPVLESAGETPNDLTRSNLHQQTIIALGNIPLYTYALHFTKLRPLGPLNKEWRAAWKNTRRLKTLAKSLDSTRLNQYAEEYLALVDDPHREPLRNFLNHRFQAGGESFRDNRYFKNTFDMIAWATESLSK